MFLKQVAVGVLQAVVLDAASAAACVSYDQSARADTRLCWWLTCALHLVKQQAIGGCAGACGSAGVCLNQLGGMIAMADG